MQNADPRLNVSQQQQQAPPPPHPSATPGPQGLNNVIVSNLNTQNNGLSTITTVGTPSSIVPGVISGTNAVPPMGPSNIDSATLTPGSTINGPPVWLQNELSNLQSQQATLQEQVRQSEQNLAAQHASLMAQQQGRVEDAVRQAQETSLQNSAQSTSTDLAAFDSVLQPIIDSCTKDSISAGKAWILQHSISPESNQVVADHLLKK